MSVELLYLALLLVATLFVGSVAAWLYRRADARSARLLALTLAADAVTGLFVAGELLAPAATLAEIMYGVHYGFATTVPLLFFLFAVSYAGDRRWLSERMLRATAVWIALVVVIGATNPLHGFAFTGFETMDDGVSALFGIATVPYLVLSFPSQFLYYGGMGLLGHRMLFSSSVDRRQNGLLFVAFLPALAVTALLFSEWFVGSMNGAFVLGSIWTAAIVAVAVERYDLFELVPMARGEVVERFDEGVVVVDADRRLLDYNATAAEEFPALTGNTGTDVEELVPDLIGDDGFATSFTRYDRDEPREYEVTASDLADAGDGRGQALIVRDVTDRRQRVRELEQKTAQLERFASTLSHDIRNPLSVARGELELASEEPSEDHFERADRALDRIEQIIEDVLLLAREGRTIEEADRRRVDLGDVVREAWKTTDTAEATLEIEPDAEPTVYADRTRLRTVLENLFRNAVEHGGPDVTVTCGRHSDGFYVEDDGPGVSEAERDRIFEYGYSSGEDGTGLGLAICEAVVRAHGWELDLAESPDGGARFVVSDVDFVDVAAGDAAVSSP